VVTISVFTIGYVHCIYKFMKKKKEVDIVFHTNLKSPRKRVKEATVVEVSQRKCEGNKGHRDQCDSS
jgi:hypothetical protein